MELLKKAHARHLTNQLAESEDALSEEQEIEILSQDITEVKTSKFFLNMKIFQYQIKF